MMSDRTIARVVGVLFILASASAIVGGSLLLPLDESNYLEAVVGNSTQVLSGALVEMVLVISVIGIAVMFYPVLRRRNEGLALGYVGARTLEGVSLLAASFSALVVFNLGDQTGEAAGAQLLGDSILATRDWTYLIGSMVFFGVSAVILNGLLYRARLVPAWLSVWGLLGGMLIMVIGLVEMYGAELSGTAETLFAAPIGLQEMVLALWLIIKGFDTASPRIDAIEELQPEPLERIEAPVSRR